MPSLSNTIACIVLMTGIVSGQDGVTSDPISSTTQAIGTTATARPTTSDPYSECGTVSNEGFRIIGGQDAKDGQYPWVARIRLDSPRYAWNCVGAIIDEMHILTVAHCVLTPSSFLRAPRVPSPRYFTVYTGSTSRLAGTARRVERVTKHPNYNSFHLDFDIAILKLFKPIKFNSMEGRVCLNQVFQEEAGKPCRVLGWGSTVNSTSEDGLYPDTLQVTTDPMLSKEECLATFKDTGYDDYLCGAGGERNFCWRDAGAPYVCQEEQRWYLFGLAAYHLSPVTCTQPGQYTKVSYFYDWIQSITASASSKKCGVVRDDGFKIIGGQDAKDGQYPWVARIVLQNEQFNMSCAGAIISESLVLTVAHCVQPDPTGDQFFQVQDPSYFTVYTGSVSRFEGKARQVEKVIRHEQYDAYYLDYDIAILKLSEPIKINYNEDLVCLNRVFPEVAGKQCRVLGWGLASNESGDIIPPKDALQSAVNPMLNRTQCEDYFGSFYFPDFLCGAGGDQNFCRGDSGAPYVCQEGRRWYLYGLAVSNVGRINSTAPGRYTKMSYFRDWIKEKMDDLS